MDPRENCERTFLRVPHPFRGQFTPSSLSLPNLPRSRWRYPHRAPSPPNGSASRPAPCVAALHPEGFEPPTLGFEDRCSIRLSYECYAFLRNVLREPKSRISRPLQPEKVTLKCVTCRASVPSKPTTLTRVAECLHKNDHGTYFALLKVRGKQIKKSLKTKDAAVAKRHLATHRAKAQNLLSEDGNITFSNLATRWLNVIKPDLRPRSWQRLEGPYTPSGKIHARPAS